MNRNEFYTIDDVAAMTMLSTRTIRNYISLGLLDGEKIDGAWQFTPEQFSDFLLQDMVRQSVKAKANAIIYDFLLQEKKSEASVCSVLDLPVAAGGEPRLRQRLMDMVNTHGLHCSYHYEQSNATARLILRGTPAAVAALLSTLE